jgi:uncharacterized membrane-anchored protein
MSRAWWAAAGVRAVRTFAQACLATIPGTAIISTQTDWLGMGYAVANILGSAALAAILSLLTSLSGLPEVECQGEV